MVGEPGRGIAVRKTAVACRFDPVRSVLPQAIPDAERPETGLTCTMTRNIVLDTAISEPVGDCGRGRDAASSPAKRPDRRFDAADYNDRAAVLSE